MTRFKIGLIERDVFLADNLVKDLHTFGYEIAPVATCYEKAIKIIEEEKPHLILIAITLNGDKDGVDVAHHVRENYSMPIIFLSDHLDLNTIERLKEVKPNAFLEKPFTNLEMYASIELALLNYQPHLNYILVKDGYMHVRVCIEQILFIDSERNYLNLHLANGRKVIIRSTMVDMMERLNGKDFNRINRGCIINMNHVTKIDTNNVFINERHFPVSKQQRDELIEMIEKKSQQDS